MRYAGIGSRETPPEVIKQMIEFAELAGSSGWVLRSGGANGADLAFETGCDLANGPKEIFIPWQGFNKSTSPRYPPTADATKVASIVHPAYNRLSSTARLLIARNMHQILGASLKEPVDCVVCWTKDGCESMETYGRETGGTGSAIALASVNNIPVFNFKLWNRFDEAMYFLANGDSK